MIKPGEFQNERTENEGVELSKEITSQSSRVINEL